MTRLTLTPDELLSTTRSVRRRLDLSRAVEREVIEDCLRLAQQAPSGSNRQHWRFLVITDAEKKRALAGLYRRGWEIYRRHQAELEGSGKAARRPARYEQVRASADYLVERLQEVPVLVIPCIAGRLERAPAVAQAATWGSILPATWSFMLAARARGLGTCWTTFHLHFEKEAAELLGIPFAEYTQAGLIPVAYTRGTDFKPAPREPLETIVSWNAW
jgi:nitroreductase